MSQQKGERSPEFQQFLQEVEVALIKSAAEARRVAEQTGTKLIVYEADEEGKLPLHFSECPTDNNYLAGDIK